SGILLQLHQNDQPIRLAKMPTLVKNADKLEEELKQKVEEIALLCEWPGHKVDRAQKRAQASLTPEEQTLFSIGRKHYLTSCASCHGDDGRGIGRFAPPLKGSEWVLGDDRQLALILLHGIEGPIEVNGHTYQAPEILPVMPAHSVLNDKEIAAVMTYIRNDWGNNGGAIKPGRVGHIRHRSQGRVQPWDVKDLNAHLAGLENQDL
ncbi:MAG: cytochrome c, partial [Saprospiraceae bacterium]|nr:cytochrome c [Saprospiraceae bacterium]